MNKVHSVGLYKCVQILFSYHSFLRYIQGFRSHKSLNASYSVLLKVKRIAKCMSVIQAYAFVHNIYS